MAQLFRYMDATGDGSGNTNFNLNYSDVGLGAEQALLIPGPLEIFTIARLLISVEDTSGMTANEYGNTGGVLTNGITIKTYDSSDVVTTDITAGVPIKTNAQWGALCYDVARKTWGEGNELLVVRFTLAKSGAPTILDGRKGEYMAINFNDDLTGLISHRYMVQGVQ